MSSTLPIKTGSAGEHIWREIRISVYPGRHALRWAVFLRKTRGTDLIWSRNLSAGSTLPVAEQQLDTGGGVLRAAAAAMLEVADEMDRQDP